MSESGTMSQHPNEKQFASNVNLVSELKIISNYLKFVIFFLFLTC